MSKKLFRLIGIEILILALICVGSKTLHFDKSVSVTLLFVNQVYLMIVNWCCAKRGDAYICVHHPELYRHYYRHDWINRPQFIAVRLLFEQQPYTEDLKSLMREAKVTLVFLGGWNHSELFSDDCTLSSTACEKKTYTG